MTTLAKEAAEKFRITAPLQLCRDLLPLNSPFKALGLTLDFPAASEGLFLLTCEWAGRSENLPSFARLAGVSLNVF